METRTKTEMAIQQHKNGKADGVDENECGHRTKTKTKPSRIPVKGSMFATHISTAKLIISKFNR